MPTLGPSPLYLPIPITQPKLACVLDPHGATGGSGTMLSSHV